MLHSSNNPVYTRQAYENDAASGARLTEVRTTEEMTKIFSERVEVHIGDQAPHAADSEPEMLGYLNHEGGWAESARSLEILLARVRQLGGKVLGGKDVAAMITHTALDYDSFKHYRAVTGVKCTDGTSYLAPTVIVAAGAWTPSLMQRLGMARHPDVPRPSEAEANALPLARANVGLGKIGRAHV